MKIEICKWFQNASSPVLLMIDDLANVWVDANGNGQVDLEEDWGYAKDSEESGYRYLKQVILKDYIDVKVTFFTPVGIRVGMIENSSIKSISKMINCDVETKKFFKSVNENSKNEIAYHGTTHGKVGDTLYNFIQEWESFNSLPEAIAEVTKGQEVYKDVFGDNPRGGKYCGYKTNEFSDKSIDMTGFFWWCRFWNRGLIEDENCSIGGTDLNPLTNFDIKTFGSNNVIDIPSTLNGGLFTRIFNPNIKTLKGIAKVVLKEYLVKRKLKQIKYLLDNKLVISIQEHISPASDGGGRQTPNIFDDQKSLKTIFNYLEDKNVWYCTGSQLAEYYYISKNISIVREGINTFKIEYFGKKVITNKMITIKIDDKSIKKVMLPNEIVIVKINGVFNLPLMEGYYSVNYE